MSSNSWSDFGYNALNTVLGVWATKEQAKIASGTVQPGPHSLGQQGAVTGTPQTDSYINANVKKKAWYQRPEFMIGGALLVGVGVYAMTRRKR